MVTQQKAKRQKADHGESPNKTVPSAPSGTVITNVWPPNGHYNDVEESDDVKPPRIRVKEEFNMSNSFKKKIIVYKRE